jgi:hypothetical protein
MKFKQFRFLLVISILIALASCKIRNQEKYYLKAKEEFKCFDAIIVPGYPFYEDNWDRVMKMRVYWAKYLWDNKMTKNIIFSGGAVYSKYSECKIMKLYAIELGIPEEHIFLDSLAEHSTENVFYSSIIAKENNFKTIAIASDPFQTKLLKKFIKKINRRRDLDIQILPTIMDTLLIMETKDFEIDYEKAIGSNFIDIVNTQSKFYRFRGTLGLHIDWDYKK